MADAQAGKGLVLMKRFRQQCAKGGVLHGEGRFPKLSANPLSKNQQCLKLGWGLSALGICWVWSLF